MKNLRQNFGWTIQNFVYQIFGPFQKSVKILTNPQSLTKFWLDLAKFLARSRVGSVKFSDLTGPVEFFDLVFTPRVRKFSDFDKSFCQNLYKKFREVRNFLSSFWKFFSWKFPKGGSKSERNFRF